MKVHAKTFRRYCLIPVNKRLNVFLHVYFANTELAFHDHPWWNVTIRLWGNFVESRIPNYMSLDRGTQKMHVNPWFVFRRATTAHKMKATRLPLVTLFITGPEWNVVGGRA